MRKFFTTTGSTRLDMNDCLEEEALRMAGVDPLKEDRHNLPPEVQERVSKFLKELEEDSELNPFATENKRRSS